MSMGGHLCWILWCAVCNALSPGGKSQGLFDVEIGQFESVSFNFSPVTGTPWVHHTFLIGNFLFLHFSVHPPPPPFHFLYLSDLSCSIHFHFALFAHESIVTAFLGSFQRCHQNPFMLLLKLNLAHFSILKATGLIVRGSRSSKM